MPTELEAKLKVEDLAAVRQRLVAVGAERVSKVREVNTYLQMPDPDSGCACATRRTKTAIAVVA